MRNTYCVICGRKTEYEQICQRCNNAWGSGKDGRVFKEPSCPRVEIVKVVGNYGSHHHVWPKSHEVLDIYWKKQKNGRFLLSVNTVEP